MPNVTAIIVTYNRKTLLLRCLAAIVNQTRRPDRIIIVDNASTDGTCELLKSDGWLQCQNFELLSLDDNTGGAGGFAEGLKHAVETGTEWAWMMDDDAVPHREALENLLNRKLNKGNIYASTAVSCSKLSWPMVPEGQPDSCIFLVSQVPDELIVELVPFIGVLVSKELVDQIGVPDKDFFLVADDVEYSLRARELGAKIILVGTSKITHPASEWYNISLIYRQLHVLKLSPWKRYYEIRNRFLLHKYHLRRRLGFQNYVGWLLRLIATLLHEKDRYGQLRAYVGGMIDGSLERKGRRHIRWGL